MRKICDVRFRTSLLSPTGEALVSLTPSIRTLVRISSLSLHTVVPYKHVFLDSMDSLSVWPIFCNSVALEYSTCLPMELKWLKYPRVLVEHARRMESIALSGSLLVITPNELLKNYARTRGAKEVCLMPNYPLRSFAPRFTSALWRRKHGIEAEVKVALFMAGGHMKEIYGLDLLLESWKKVEPARSDSLLVIIGPAGRVDLDLLLHKLGLRNVRATGTISHDELPDWVQIADCCLAPLPLAFQQHFTTIKTRPRSLNTLP